MSARIFAEIGDDTDRFISPAGLRAFAGTAPINAHIRAVALRLGRKVRTRLGAACRCWALSMLTKSAVRGRTTTNVERSVSVTALPFETWRNELLGRPWWCLQRNEPWDDSIAWTSRSATESTSTAVAA
ncbi:hypothetical protein PXH69_34430 [Rhodococcus qingshengii]|uniref:Transposase n=1 Tax=Rhodococcus qingshengii TaxID=334542 RepID=A0AAW6LQZ8_RHOSG|nr:hypothetical protein [Rhodococcus qingshengii]MDE8650057.1 hypothetical protein [Rhodococcus qingshengii]